MAYTTIKKPSDYFNTKLYTGNGSTQYITGVGFQPDFIWNKQRNGTNSHYLFNAITGTGKFLKSNTADAEGTNTDTVTSFDSDGFTLGSAAGNNGSGNTMASWNWLANGAGSANTDGSISSTVSANTTSGFSIVSYTGTGSNATVGHGLGSVVKMFFVKELSNTNSWEVYHVSEGAGKNAQLNSNAVFESAGSSRWNSTAPTSTTISIGTDSGVNRSSGNYIAYCFAEKQGYSKFGSYTGNGNADGTFVYTGFKPAFIMIKDADNLEQWFIFDNKRNLSNVSKNLLYASDGGAETTSGANQIDILSNGFKMRSTDNGTNRSGGGGFTYMTFAEQPLVGDNPATAR